MFVYIVQAGSDGPVKIGMARSIMSRIDAIRCGNHEEIYLRRLFVMRPGDEMELHRRFSEHRIRGEWFRPVAEILAGNLGLAEIPAVEIVRGRTQGGYHKPYSANTPHSKIIAAMGGKHELARLTGATPNAVTQWRRIGIPARYWHVLVEEAERRGIEGITFDALAASKPGAAQDAAA